MYSAGPKKITDKSAPCIRCACFTSLTVGLRSATEAAVGIATDNWRYRSRLDSFFTAANGCWCRIGSLAGSFANLRDGLHRHAIVAGAKLPVDAVGDAALKCPAAFD